MPALTNQTFINIRKGEKEARAGKGILLSDYLAKSTKGRDNSHSHK